MVTCVTCRDCAIEYEAWPEGGCPNCGSPEPAPPPRTAAAPGPELAGLPEFDGGTPREFPGTGEPMEAVDAGLGEEADAPPDYSSWTVADLRAECERRGLPTSGVKAALVDRLSGG